MIIAQEIVFPFDTANADVDAPIFAIVDIDKKSHLDRLIAINHQQVIPMLYQAPSCAHTLIDDRVSSYEAAAQALVNAGYKTIGLSIDGDGALQQLLSPRFSDLDLADRLLPVLEIFQALNRIAFAVYVSLTVEELAPGGIDPTDGIAIAQALSRCGLKQVIATAGTGDFPLLLNRRATKQKNEGQAFGSNEPALASAIWLKEHTDLKVSCSLSIDDRQAAIELAQKLGLVMLLEKA